MPLFANTKQNKEKTIENFYSDFVYNQNGIVGQNIADNMLEFIRMINQAFVETKLWGLTSHFRLVLQSEDKWNAGWYIIVSCVGGKEYYFEYLLPDNKSPWPNAYVRGVAYSLNEAKNYLLIAMKETGGWTLNDELRKLFLELK